MLTYFSVINKLSQCTVGNWYTWWSVYCYEYKLTNVQEGPHYERRVVYFSLFRALT